MVAKFENFENNNIRPEVDYYDNGKIKTLRYYLYGNLHRKDDPAYMTFFENGQKESVGYYLYGKMHRIGGPAYIRWYYNGNMSYYEYYKNNLNHREDGLAYEEWYLDGNKQDSGYYLFGKRYTREEWLEKLKDINSPYYEEQQIIYDAEKKYNL